MIKKILFAFAAIGLLAGPAQAKTMFGINAGATWGLYDGFDGSFEVPIAGVHAIFSGKGLFSVRSYAEYATIGIDAGAFGDLTFDSIGFTALATIGKKFFVGLGPSYSIGLDDGAGNSLSLALGMGYNFTPNFFIDIRASSELNPDTGSFLDSIPLAFQLGYSFGKGR